MNYYLKIAGVTFQIEVAETFQIAENIRQFFVEESDVANVDVRYKVILEKEFCPISGKILYQKSERIIMESESSEVRIHLIPGIEEPFAYYMEISEGECEIHILENFLEKRVITTNFLDLLAVEKYLIAHDALILHSSFVVLDGKAVIFSAPSGTGKSTQARLWEKYKGAQIVNGDRSVIRVGKDGVYAYGLPFCGSSGINLNQSAPLAGIVLLEQDDKDSIERCSVATAVKKIYSECSINSWNSNFVIEAFNTAEKVVNAVLVCKLKCTISEIAVNLAMKEVFSKGDFM